MRVSPSARAAIDRARSLARHSCLPVLLTGETGTGKSYLARYIHEWSDRASGGFVTSNVAALDDGIASSDLFGHVVGAFTDARRPRQGSFLAAHRGSLFLDEIGKASETVQRKLLRAVEAGEIQPVGADRPVRVDVRLITASNVPLEGLVDDGRFLPDLLARIGAFVVRLPALRERRPDIPGLVHQLLERRAPQLGYEKRVPEIDEELILALSMADWPYNLRGLDSAVCELLLEAAGASVLTLHHCSGDLKRLRSPRPMQDVTVDVVVDAVHQHTTATAAAGLDPI